MTTIYTKPQLDAIAVKIGGEIKAAKTTVTQEQGQSTTYAVSQKMITDSLSAFGTAAYKNMGTAAGNVMEVGAFGVGGNSSGEIPTMSNYLPNSFIATSPVTVGNSNYYALGLQLNGANQWQVYLTVQVTTGDMLIGNRADPSSALSWGKVWTDKNTPTSNLPVASIQAGIGAPKIAYKKLTGVTATGNGVPHGLDASKILSISCSYLNGVVYWALTPKWNATEIDISSISSGFSYKLLITYEVD